MYLPEKIQYVLTTLEQAGYAAFCVGGCVRDDLLGIPPHDYDVCTAAGVDQTASLFSSHPQVHAGEKHGTVGVILDGELVEITTFRTEGDYQDHRHPGWVKFVKNVEADLARRDFTVNAMAYSPQTGLVDPYGGAEDLKNKVLRAVGDPEKRFSEDALRILRGMRFAARFRLTPEKETLRAMFALRASLGDISRERVFAELNGALPRMDLEDFLTFGPVLAAAIPELEPTLGFCQHSPHHAYDLYTHIAHVTAALPREPVLRWAGLLHDLGKVPTFTRDETGRGHFYGHAQVGAEMAGQVLLRLRAPNALRERVVTLIDQHMTPLTAEEPLLRKRLRRLGKETVGQLLTLQRADFSSKGTGETEDDSPFDRVAEMLSAILSEKPCLSLRDLAVTGKDLMGLGIPPGKEMGAILNRLLEQTAEGILPNEKEALLRAAAKEVES